MIKLLRPHQYIKNIFVFAPLFFSFNFLYLSVINSLISFAMFCVIASSIYILNDIIDIEEDKQHPKKKFRPIASGKVSKQMAKKMMVALMGFGLIIALFYNVNLFVVLMLYVALNIFYSLKLKHVSIVDIFVIATGFVLRLFAGSVSIKEPLSMWIVLMTFLLALFLAIAKRRDDVLLSINGNKTRKNIDGYNLEFVNAIMVFMSSVIVVSYILYTVSEDVAQKLQTTNLYLTSLFVILGIVRYMQITFVELDSGSPTKIILKDKFMQCTILLWLFSFYVLVNF